MKKWLSLISFVFLVIGCGNQKPPIIVKETNDSIWVKRYSIFGDSAIYRYHQPEIYYGKIIRRRNSKHSRRNLWIKLDNGKTIHRKRVSHYYNFRIGDRVKITYIHYPYSDVKLEKN